MHVQKLDYYTEMYNAIFHYSLNPSKIINIVTFIQLLRSFMSSQIYTKIFVRIDDIIIIEFLKTSN